MMPTLDCISVDIHIGDSLLMDCYTCDLMLMWCTKKVMVCTKKVEELCGLVTLFMRRTHGGLGCLLGKTTH